MSIRMRRGVEANYDPTKMESGELAVCLDTNKVYFMGSNSTKLANAILPITKSAVSSLPVTITTSDDPKVAYVTDDMLLVGFDLSNPSAMTGDWTWTTGNGSVTLSGSISGSTNVTLRFTNSR